MNVSFKENARVKFIKVMLAVFCLTVGTSLYSVDVFAADNGAGAGTGVAIGTGSNAPKAENVAIGKGASVGYSNGASNATGDIAIGNGANINNYASQGGSIAMGSNAKIENMAGGGEASFAFGQTTYSGGIFSSARIPADPTKAPGSIAIGQNTFARTGSTMIGVHNYKGALGDTTVDSSNTRKDNLNVYSTTIGANSNSNGAFTTLSGAYSIISSDYNGGRLANPIKNFGATVTGSLNSVESMTGGFYSGIANTVSGLANRTNNSNGSLVYGAGNTITNSFTSLTGVPTNGGDSAKDFQTKLIEAIKIGNGGGSTMAFGGGNTADYTQLTQLTGVNNTITGTAGKIAKLNSVSGFKNTITNASNNIIMGNDYTVTADNTIAIGGRSSGETRSVANTVSVGYDAKATVANGVALGHKSVASVDKGAVGYDLSTNGLSSETNSTWKATDAAVSVGDGTTITRQITSVAAGTNDTDAVNVAQLKKAVASAGGNVVVKGGTPNVTVTSDTTTPGTTTYTVSVAGGATDPVKYAADTGSSLTINGGDTVNVKGGATGDLTDGNIGVAADGDKTLTVKLAKDVKGLNSVSVTNGPTINTNGIDMGDKKITNLKDGDISATSTDAVTGKQLFNATQKVDKLDSRISKVGAGAAALAALHPLDFDPDDKWSIAAGYGNYSNANAVSIGAFYRPNEDTMFSVGGALGNGENMINAGVSLKLGQSNGTSNSRVAMAKEIKNMKAMMAALIEENHVMKDNMKKLSQGMRNVEFPDVPKDHWAYDYVTTLANRGLLEGYPDGQFKGDRAMTRYEFAAIIYRALQNGAAIDGKMGQAMAEFGPELEKIRAIDNFRIDRVAGKDTDRHKIERVRVNNEDTKTRDVYGNHVI